MVGLKTKSQTFYCGRQLANNSSCQTGTHVFGHRSEDGGFVEPLEHFKKSMLYQPLFFPFLELRWLVCPFQVGDGAVHTKRRPLRVT